MRNPVRSLQAKRFERVIEPCMDHLRRLAIRLTGSTDDAEDLLQDLMVRLHPRMDEVAALERPRPWLARVLYRLFVDEWRRRRSAPDIDTAAEPDDSAGSEPRPDDAFEQGLTRGRLQSALDRLPAFQRELILMHDVEGYTLVEITEITETPIGTLKSRLHRARAALRADLAGERAPPQDRVDGTPGARCPCKGTAEENRR